MHPIDNKNLIKSIQIKGKNCLEAIRIVTVLVDMNTLMRKLSNN